MDVYHKLAMKSKKQKNKERDQQALQQKEQKKRFLENLKSVCNQYAGEDLFSKLPVEFLETVYKWRVGAVNIDVSDPLLIKEEKEGARIFINNLLDNYTFELPGVEGVVNFRKHLVGALSLWMHTSKNNSFPILAEVRRVMNPYFEEKLYSEAMLELLRMETIFSMVLSDFSRGVLSWEYQYGQLDGQRFRNTFKIKKEPFPKESFVIDSVSRPAYRVGWRLDGQMEWSEIKPSVLGLPKKNAPLPVYVQMHALYRMEERLGMHTGHMHAALMASMRNPVIHPHEKNQFLIPYSFNLRKLGYLVCSVENQCVFIHTFLFLTNNGTPEGKKLNKLTGLEKMDKKYIGIDKLSTFLSYNISENEFVKKLFIKAGCGELLDLSYEKDFMGEKTESQDVNFIADYLLNNTAFRLPSLAREENPEVPPSPEIS